MCQHQSSLSPTQFAATLVIGRRSGLVSLFRKAIAGAVRAGHHGLGRPYICRQIKPYGRRRGILIFEKGRRCRTDGCGSGNSLLTGLTMGCWISRGSFDLTVRWMFSQWHSLWEGCDGARSPHRVARRTNSFASSTALSAPLIADFRSSPVRSGIWSSF